MSKLSQFLEELEDFEIAFFFTFKKANYLPQSQALIDQEIAKRKLSSEAIKLLIEKKINEEPLFNSMEWRCSYCKSRHYFEKREEIERPFDNSKANIFNSIFDSHPPKIYENIKNCIICGTEEDISQ